MGGNPQHSPYRRSKTECGIEGVCSFRRTVILGLYQTVKFSQIKSTSKIVYLRSEITL